MTMKAASGDVRSVHNVAYKDKAKPTDIRNSNINAAKGKFFYKISTKTTSNHLIPLQSTLIPL